MPPDTPQAVYLRDAGGEVVEVPRLQYERFEELLRSQLTSRLRQEDAIRLSGLELDARLEGDFLRVEARLTAEATRPLYQSFRQPIRLSNLIIESASTGGDLPSQLEAADLSPQPAPDGSAAGEKTDADSELNATLPRPSDLAAEAIASDTGGGTDRGTPLVWVIGPPKDAEVAGEGDPRPPQTCTLALTGYLPTEEVDGRRVVVFDLPPVPGRCTVRLPKNIDQLNWTELNQQKIDRQLVDDQTVVTRVGLGDRSELSWEDARGDETILATEVQSGTRFEVRQDGSPWTAVTRLTVKSIAATAPRDVVVELPPGADWNAVEDAAVRGGWTPLPPAEAPAGRPQPPPGDAAQQAKTPPTVRLQRRVSAEQLSRGGSPLEIRWSWRPPTAGDAAVQIPVPAVANVERHEGTVELLLPLQSEITWQTGAGASLYKRSLEAGPPERLNYTFKFTHAPPDIRCRIGESTDRLQYRPEFIAELQADAVRLTGILNFAVDPSQMIGLEILPQGWTVKDVLWNQSGQAIDYQSDEQGAIRIDPASLYRRGELATATAAATGGRAIRLTLVRSLPNSTPTSDTDTGSGSGSENSPAVEPGGSKDSQADTALPLELSLPTVQWLDDRGQSVQEVGSGTLSIVSPGWQIDPASVQLRGLLRLDHPGPRSAATAKAITAPSPAAGAGSSAGAGTAAGVSPAAASSSAAAANPTASLNPAAAASPAAAAGSASAAAGRSDPTAFASYLFDGRGEPPVWRATLKPKAALAAQTVETQLSIAASAYTLRKTWTVEQREPQSWDFRLLVPPQLADELRRCDSQAEARPAVQFFLDQTPLRCESLIAVPPESSGATDGWVVFAPQLPQLPAKFQLRLEASLPLPPATAPAPAPAPATKDPAVGSPDPNGRDRSDDEATLLEVPLPRLSSARRLVTLEHRTTLRVADAWRAELIDDAAAASPTADIAVLPGEIEPLPAAVQDSASLKLRLTRLRLLPAASVRVNQVWLQTALNGSERRDRCVLDIRTRDRQVEVVLAPGDLNNLTSVLVDGQRVEPQRLGGTMTLVIPLPPSPAAAVPTGSFEDAAFMPVSLAADDPSGANGPSTLAPLSRPAVGSPQRHTIELWLWSKMSDQLVYPIAENLPRLRGAAEPAPKLWQVIVPKQDHLWTASDSLLPEYSWRWRQFALHRVSSLDQAALERLTGASEQTAIGSDANHYLFSSLAARLDPQIASDPQRVYVAPRYVLFVPVSLLCIALVCVLIYFPVLRSVWVLGSVAAVAAAVAFVATDVAVLMMQAAAASSFFVAVLLMVRWSINRRVSRRSVFVNRGRPKSSIVSDAEEVDFGSAELSISATGESAPHPPARGHLAASSGSGVGTTRSLQQVLTGEGDATDVLPRREVAGNVGEGDRP